MSGEPDLRRAAAEILAEAPAREPKSSNAAPRRIAMNEIASATLVIQIFESIRRFPAFSSTLPRFSSAFLPPLILSFLSLPPPAILTPRILLGCRVENTREPLSLLASTVVLPVSAFTCVCFSPSLFLSVRVSGITSTSFYDPFRMHG